MGMQMFAGKLCSSPITLPLQSPCVTYLAMVVSDVIPKPHVDHPEEN